VLQICENFDWYLIRIEKLCAVNNIHIRFIRDLIEITLRLQNVPDTLDGLIKQRSKLGMPLDKRQAQMITVEMEETLWSSRLLGDQDLETLLNTVVYALGLHLALREREKHRR
jgi:hypothetical protein